MLAIFLIVFNINALGVEHTNSLPIPWGEKLELFDKIDPKMIEIGESLFFDPILSRTKKVSCGTCHIPEYGFSNGHRTAKGINGIETEYNVPVLFNRIESKIQFWDGRVSSLREQIYHPILNQKEMGMDEEEVLKRLNSSPSYKKKFGVEITRDLVESSLQSFILSLVSGNSRYDRYVAGDTSALTPDEIEGKKLFFETYKCVRCHSGPGFTNESLALRCGSVDATYTTPYKVPTLRNLRLSNPYLHSGRLQTLADVLEFYDQKKNENGLSLTASDKRRLVLFLNTLSSPIVSYRPKAHAAEAGL